MQNALEANYWLLDGWMDEQMGKQMYEQTDGQTDEQTDEQTFTILESFAMGGFVWKNHLWFYPAGFIWVNPPGKS